MKKTNFWAVSLLFIGIAALATGCDVVKDTKEILDNSTETVASLTATANDVAQAENFNYEIESSSDYFITKAQMGGYQVKSAVSGVSDDSVTIDVTPKGSLSYPKTITIDYGSIGVLGKRGNKLKGRIIVKLTAALTSPNSSRTITFEGFSVNGNEVKGTKTVTFNGSDTWTVSAKDTIITATGVKIVSNSDRVRKLVDATTGKFQISGFANGINKKGKAYSMKIADLKPLILFADHPFFVGGLITTTTENRTVDLDYGDGITKDEKATITYNGVSQEINLKP